MKNIEVTIEKNPSQITGDIQNFTVIPKDFEPGVPTGHGSTKLQAIADFIETWMLKYDEDITIKEL